MKKRLAAIILAALVVAMPMPAAALADGAGLLSVDNQHLYAGMGKTYAAGYVPAESGGKVRIVLPLVASAAIQGSITVKPELGAPGSTPFVLGNYIETVALSPQSVDNGADTVSAYLIDLSLPLAKDRIRGTYPVTIGVAYKDGSGADMQQSFALYVTVGGKAPATVPPPEQPRHQPKVIVSSYSVDPGPVAAGQDFKVSFTLKNTSASYAVYNMKVTVKSADADLSPANNANTQYFESLAKDGSLSVEFPMKAKPDAAAGAHGVTVSVDYEDSKATGFSASDDIPVVVTQPLRLEFDAPNVPASMTAGDTAPFTLQVMNKGRSSVYNVTCVLSAPGLLPQASAFLGNMEAGTAKPAQFVVFAGTLDMTSDGTTAAPGGASGFGKTAGTITITYEDEFGKQYTGAVNIKTTINAPVMPTAQPEAPPQPKAGQWWVSALIAAGLIIAVAVLVILSGRSRRGKVQAREEQ